LPPCGMTRITIPTGPASTAAIHRRHPPSTRHRRPPETVSTTDRHVPRRDNNLAPLSSRASGTCSVF
jgi:hypothetical protein